MCRGFPELSGRLMGKRPVPKDQRAKHVADICQRMSEGALASAECERVGISFMTLWRWIEADEGLRDLYARAREAQAHWYAEAAMRAAAGTDDYAEAVELVLEWEQSKVDDLPVTARQAAQTLLNSLRNSVVSRDKLRVDTLKWTAGKLSPKYSDKQQVEHSGAVTLKVEYGDEDE